MQRLDIYISKINKDFSRNFCQKFIKSIGVIVNGKRVKKPNFLVRESDVVLFSEKEFEAFIGSQSTKTPTAGMVFDEKNLIYSSKNFIVFDKPAFISTEEIIGELYPVHRLDRNTSGALVIAKNPQTQNFCQKQWQKRTVKKTYIALLKGHISPKKGAIDAGIFRSTKDRRKMAISSAPKSRKAYTEYEVSKYYVNNDIGEKFTLVKVYPLTGRTHQIRIHFASIGHPVVGDEVYGDKKLNKKIVQYCGLNRQFLHAYKLKLRNPETKKITEFTSKMPDDLYAAIKKIEQEA